MDRKTEFNVGDKVLLGNSIGTVTNITPKKKDIKVDFGSYTMKFGFDGWTRDDIWHTKHIEKWTPEKQKIIDDKMLINECRKMFEDICRLNKLTPDTARKIIGILREGTV